MPKKKIPLLWNTWKSIKKMPVKTYDNVSVPTLYSTDRIIPPSFTKTLKETHGLLGSTGVLECKVIGSPPISVSWYHDGDEITSGEKYQATLTDNTCCLRVNALEESDIGNYSCIASNVAGSDECEAYFIVRGKY